MAHMIRKPGSPIAAPPEKPAECTEFGSLADLCLSHNPGEKRELFGEFSTLYPQEPAAAVDPGDALDRLSLTRKK